MVGRLRMRGARTGEKYFAPTHAVRYYIGAGAMIYGAAMVMVGRWRINRARMGEKYFARTSVVRRRVVGARSHRVVDGASKAHVGAKYFSPVHPWWVVKLDRRHDLWCDDD